MTEIDLVEQFNSMLGRLRVSVTHQCQLRCHFCHREGIADHWVNRSMALADFTAIARAYAQIGGRYLELTGGEPTLHRNIDGLLRSGREAGCDVILCTNGLRLDRTIAAAQDGCIQLVKLSLHHDGSNREGARKLLGSAWSFGQIERNLETVIRSSVAVQLIFTHTGANEDQLEAVLERAINWRVDVQIVDLIASRVGDPSLELGYRSGTQAENIVSRYADLEEIVTDRTGAILRKYRTLSGSAWEIKDAHYGVLHSGMCNGCPVRDKCGEGIYALRVDSLGIVKPCLLRSDLEYVMSVPFLEFSVIKNVMKQKIENMLAAPLDWS